MKTLRKEIETCGKRRSQISIETDIDPAALCRIMQGGSCKAETVEKLCDYFGYKLVKKKKRKNHGKSNKK